MGNAYTAQFGDITADNFERILSSISYVEKHEYELVFPSGMIERICTEKQYPCYKFAHNLEGDSYMRARVNQVTLEFLIRKNPENQNEQESLVLQINHKCQIIYRRPQKPTATIYVKDY